MFELKKEARLLLMYKTVSRQSLMSAGYSTVEKTSVSMAPVYSPQQSGRMNIIASWDLEEDTKAQGLGGFPRAAEFEKC